MNKFGIDFNFQVIKLIQQKKSQVLFVLTGDCGNQTISEDISVYELIAAASTGQVFQLKKKDVNQMLKFVEESVQANRVNLISTDNGAAANKTYIVPVDNALEELTIALSGKDSVLEIYHPNGNIVQYHKIFVYPHIGGRLGIPNGLGVKDPGNS